MKQLKIFFKSNLSIYTLTMCILFISILFLVLEIKQFSLYFSLSAYTINPVQSRISFLNTEVVKNISSSKQEESILQVLLDSSSDVNPVLTLTPPQSTSEATISPEEDSSDSTNLVTDTVIISSNNSNNETIDSTLSSSTSGTIYIPKTHIDYPLVSEANHRAMEVSPCILYSTGSLNHSGNTMIIAHNYQNGKLFSNNYQLEIGDTIYITSSDGDTLSYVIYEKYITTPEDASFMERHIGDKPEISLSTCTNDEENRLIILAKAE